MEEWKDIEGYEGLYQVSNEGRIRSLDRYVNNYWGTKQFVRGRIMISTPNKNGYLNVTLCKNGKPKRFYVHRLVAEAFIPNPDNKPCIDHISTDVKDNRPANLKWCTHKENSNNFLTKCHMSDSQKKNESNIERLKILSEKKKKKICQFTLGGELVAIFESASDAARKLNYCQESIWYCCNGGYFDKSRNKWHKCETYKNYLWRFLNDMNIGGQKKECQ